MEPFRKRAESRVSGPDCLDAGLMPGCSGRQGWSDGIRAIIIIFNSDNNNNSS